MKGFRIIFRVLAASCIVLSVSSEETVPKGKSNSALIPCEGTTKANNLSYEWHRDSASSSPLKDQPGIKDRVSVTADGALLINLFTKKDHGEYICRIKIGDKVVEDVPKTVDDKYRLAEENCHSASCIEAEKCSSSGSNLSCPDQGEVCCSFVRDEDKHHCRHFFGECMDECHPNVQIKRADDCKGSVCCVLVN